jgi:hypothetical protein
VVVKILSIFRLYLNIYSDYKKNTFVLFLLVSGTALAQVPEMPAPSVLKTAGDYATYQNEAMEGFTYVLKANPQELKESGILPFLITWISGSPDVSVAVNMEVIPGVMDESYMYSGEMLCIYLAGMVLAKADGETDEAAVQLAGLQAVLKAYEKVSGDQKVKEMEKLLKLREKGKLADHVRKLVP